MEPSDTHAPARPKESGLEGLVERAADIVYRVRLQPSLSFDYVSSAATRITGYTPEEHYADPDLGFRLVHPDDRPLLAAMMSSEPTPDPIVVRWRRKDGATIWTEQRNTPVYDEKGELVALEGIAREIADPTRGPGATVRVFRDLRIDLADHRVFLEGRSVHLTPSQFKVLALLTADPGRVFSRDAIMRHLWRSRHAGDGHASEVHISALRRKIEVNPRMPERIVTVRGRGYRFKG